MLAVIVIGQLPPVSAAGVPLSTPLEERVTPAGSAPDSVNVAAGKPVATAVKLPAVPVLKVAVAALVIAGAWFTVSVNDWLAFPPAELAVNVIA